MVPIQHKIPTTRKAIAACTLHFSNATALPLIRSNSLKKGDVLAVARIAGIMAAKKCSDLIPLCHPIAISSVEINVSPVGEVEASSSAGGEEVQSARWAGTGQGDAYAWHARKNDTKQQKDFGKVEIRATVVCDGKTGVEMEALTAASVAAMTVYDMCKAVDKGMRIEGLRVVRKEGGKSGTWVEGESIEEEQESPI
jgi:molybdenum cofactor biosynthesis enzyme